MVVVADTLWHAKTALDAVKIEWDNGPSGNISSADIDNMLKAGLDSDQAFVHNEKGDAGKAIAGAAKKVEAVYDYPYQNHACMEPMNTTALYTADKCQIWCPTQNGEAALAATAEAAGLPVSKCDVIKVHLGGGFGRRGFSDYVTKAVLVAKGDARHAGEAAVVARGRHGAGPLSPGDEGASHGRPGCQRQPGGPADPPVRAIHPRVRARPEALDKGKDPFTFQGYWPNRRALAGVLDRQPEDRPTRCATRTCRRASGAA